MSHWRSSPVSTNRKLSEPQDSSGSLGEGNSCFHITGMASQFLLVEELNDLT